jgi:hypothetical protein
MFNQGSKVAVLESKLDIYEDLSREMLSKLESAVDKISEGNSRIAAILAKHDERIEQSIKTDDLIIKMIDEVKQASDADHKVIHERIDRIQVELKGLSKFRWQVGGVLAVAVIAISTINAFVPRLLTAALPQVRIEQQK